MRIEIMTGFKSKAERRKFGQLVGQGKAKASTFKAREAETPAILPERIHPKKTQSIGRVKTTKVIK